MDAVHMTPNQHQHISGNVHQVHEPVQDLFRAVLHEKRVHNWVECTAAGMAIDVVSAGLSLLTVITYMVS
jgi:hypothetical protein